MTETKHTPTLKPCPFCGGPAGLQQNWPATSRQHWEVSCDKCDFVACNALTQEKSAELWNRRSDAELSRLRTSHTALVAALERTKIAIHGYIDRCDFTTGNAILEEVNRALSAEGEKDAPKDDGWIEWKGGECPVDAKATVDIKFRDGVTVHGEPPQYWSWEHGSIYVEHQNEIVAYRRAR